MTTRRLYATMTIAAMTCLAVRAAWAVSDNNTVPCYKIDIPCTCTGAGGESVSCTASAKHVVKKTATTTATKNCTSGRACGSRSTPVKNCKAGAPLSDPDSPNATCRRRSASSTEGPEGGGTLDDLDIDNAGADRPGYTL